MTTPRYLSIGARLRDGLVWLAVCVALALGVYFAGRASVAAIRRDERARVLDEGHRLADVLLSAERRHWAGLVDSLRRQTRAADTVLVTRLRTVRDTAWLPADPAPAVRYVACRAQLDTLASDCATFRATATAALAAADSQHQTDTLTLRTMATQLAAIRRSDSTKAVALARRPTWWTVAKGAMVGGAVASVAHLIGARR